VSVPVADCHNDLLMAVRYLHERGHADPFGDFWLPQLRTGGVRLQVLPVCTEDQYVGEGALRRCLLMLEEAHRLADLHSDHVSIVTTRQELEECLDTDRIALVLAIEGAEPVGQSLELVDVLWRQGVRMCSLTWNRRTMMADGIGERDTDGRLTTLGVDTVRSLEERGIVVDVSHLSEAGFFHLAEVATKPFVASHSSCRDLTDHPRNLTDRQLQLMRQLDGFVAVNAFGPFLTGTGTPSVDHYLDHVEHALSVMGEDSVGFGTDFIGDVAATVDPILTGLLASSDIPVTRGLERPADFQQLVAALQVRLGVDVTAKVAGGNLLAFLGNALP
jgi:membrane dipeptidase